MIDQSVVMGAEPQTFAGSLRGFAAFIRSGAFDDGDVETVAKKFEAAAGEIERLLGWLGQIATGQTPPSPIVETVDGGEIGGNIFIYNAEQLKRFAQSAIDGARAPSQRAALNP